MSLVRGETYRYGGTVWDGQINLIGDATMMPLTNSQIAALKTPQAAAVERGAATQVSQSKNLLRSHVLIWTHRGAEIRDTATSDRIVFSGSYDDAVDRAKQLGLWC